MIPSFFSALSDDTVATDDLSAFRDRPRPTDFATSKTRTNGERAGAGARAACERGGVRAPRVGGVPGAVPWVAWAFAAIAAPVWALGIPIGAGVRSAVTVRALSPRPSPSRTGPDRDTKQVGGGWAREGGGSLLGEP